MKEEEQKSKKICPHPRRTRALTFIKVKINFCHGAFPLRIHNTYKHIGVFLFFCVCLSERDPSDCHIQNRVIYIMIIHTHMSTVVNDEHLDREAC